SGNHEGRPEGDCWRLSLGEIALGPELRGIGLCRDIVLRLAALGQRAGALSLDTHAVSRDSVSRFPHLGFLPAPATKDEESDWDRFRRCLLGNYASLDRKDAGIAIAPHLPPEILEVLDDPDRKAYWRLA